MSSLHLQWFGVRLVVAFFLLAVVLLAHARHHLQLIQAAGIAALVVWGTFEARHAYERRRARAAHRRGSP